MNRKARLDNLVSILNRFDESVRNNQSLFEPVFELRSDFQSVRTKINRFNNPEKRTVPMNRKFNASIGLLNRFVNRKFNASAKNKKNKKTVPT